MRLLTPAFSARYINKGGTAILYKFGLHSTLHQNCNYNCLSQLPITDLQLRGIFFPVQPLQTVSICKPPPPLVITYYSNHLFLW